MSGALGSIGSLIAPVAGGFLGSSLGEGLGSLFGSGVSSLLTPSILADIGGAVGGAGAGALANPQNRGLGAAGGGLAGLLTGPGLTNLTGVASGLGGSNVTPFLNSLFGGAGWGRGAAGTAGAGAGAGAGSAAGGPGTTSTPGPTNAQGQPIPLGNPAGGAAPGTLGGLLGAGAGGAGGLGGGGILGTGMTLPQLLALLGGGGAVAKQLTQGGAANMPNYSQINALASEAMGNTGMANALRTGILPPGAEQMAEAGLADSEAGIRARYADLGLSGSTMEGQDLARAQMNTEAQKYQMAQGAAQFGLDNMRLADTVYGQIADYQLQQDKQLQDALAAFASAASGGSINYGMGGGGSTNLNSLQPMQQQ